jgi:hypothetical protein
MVARPPSAVPHVLRAVFALSVALPWPGAAQSVQTPERKQATAVRVPAASVRIDGRLDDGGWRLASPVTDFVQAEPVEGVPPSDPMEVRFLYDEDALFVGARMFTRAPSEIQAPMSRRDEGTEQAEHVFISLDTYLDRRTAYTFGVTAAGVRFDHYHADDNRSNTDSGFDPVWEARVSVDEGGWVAEMRIPFNQLRFTNTDAQMWGVNIYRLVPGRNEEVYWSLVRRTERVWASRFGELHGILGIRPTARIELLPYVASSSTLTGRRDEADPFGGGHDLVGRAGLDMKMGLGPNLTLDATINPDFGQIDADPAEVNLTAFETFFDERRPFFLEGSRLLAGEPAEDNGAEYFYSRRIGARPPESAAGDFVEHPSTTTTLGAAKVTGRLPTGTSVGVLGALTTAESARTYDVRSAAFNRMRVAPWTTYGVGRMQQEFGPAGSTVAFLGTALHRDLAVGDPLAALVTRNAFSASGDSLLRFKDGEYEVGMNLGLSHVAGEAPAIARIQGSSARYFQRPDARHLTYDPSRTSMTGVKGGVRAERRSGRHWLWQATGAFVSPEFEVNDAGRLSAADEMSASAEIEYRETQPGRLFRNYAVSLFSDRRWNYDRDLQDSHVSSELDVTWRNFWSTEFDIDFDLPAQDQRLTRGGPSMATPRGWSANLEIGNRDAATTRSALRLEYGDNEDGGFIVAISGEVTLRPTPRWQLSVRPGYERRVDDQQYVTTLEGGRVETFGRRYIFAFIDRSTISSEVRLNYTFKPDLGLEFYGEPFAASGRFDNFGELDAPRSRVRRVYGTGGTQTAVEPDGSLTVADGAASFTLRNRDFNVRSFRSNLVLRWEWRPGSTLYVVWQQNREESEVRTERIGLGDLFGSLRSTGDNIFAIKTTFWFGVR